jgi:hypothetical protein
MGRRAMDRLLPVCAALHLVPKQLVERKLFAELARDLVCNDRGRWVVSV